MATLCTYFRDLETRVDSLTGKFMADQIAGEAADPANYVPDIDRLAAFRLLAHAEIEDFLEAKAREGLNKLKEGVMAQSMTVRGVLGIFPLACAVGIQVSVAWPYDFTAFRDEARRVLREAETAIVKNNGVKGGSFFLLSLMSGKFPDEVDQSLGFSLTSYGKSRGDVAHRSAARVQTMQAPSAEVKAVSDLVLALATYFEVRST